MSAVMQPLVDAAMRLARAEVNLRAVATDPDAAVERARALVPKYANAREPLVAALEAEYERLAAGITEPAAAARFSDLQAKRAWARNAVPGLLGVLLQEEFDRKAQEVVHDHYEAVYQRLLGFEGVLDPIARKLKALAEAQPTKPPPPVPLRPRGLAALCGLASNPGSVLERPSIYDLAQAEPIRFIGIDPGIGTDRTEWVRWPPREEGA